MEFEITVSWSDWKKYLDEAAKDISQEIKIQGFRPGKAPRHLVEQKVGKGEILNNAAQKAVQKSYTDYVLAEKLDVIGRPEVTILKIAEGNDLIYKAVVTVMPEVKIDEKYKEEVKKINQEYANKKIEIKEDDINLELDKLANSRVKLVTVNREAKKNDSVEIDFEVLMGGVPIENGTSKKHSLILGRGVFIPGFEDNLVGMKEGEEKEFELSFPEDYHKKDLAGKPAKFKVKLNLVQERQTPEINDDFAKSLGEFENLESLRKKIREGMEHEEKHKREDQKRNEYMEKIIEKMDVELPELLINQEIDRMLEEFEQQLHSMGMHRKDYLEKLNKKEEELRQEWKPQAEKRIKSALALEKIAKQENIEVQSQEVEEEMNKTLQYYKNVKDLEKNIDMARLYNYSKSILENEKVFKFLEKLQD